MKSLCSYAVKYTTIVLILLAISSNLCAQEENTSVAKNSTVRMLHLLMDIKPTIYPKQNRFNEDKQPLTYQALPFDLNVESPQLNKISRQILENKMSPVFKGEYNVAGTIKQFDRGALVGAGRQTNLLNLGKINTARIAYHHQFNNRLQLKAGIGTTVFSGYKVTNQSIDLAGLLSYKLYEKLTFHTFGSYSKSISTNFESYQYGASMSYDITDKFGMEVGAQRYYNSAVNKWDTAPIIAPYYKLKKVNLGMDFGGVAKEVIRGLIK